MRIVLEFKVDLLFVARQCFEVVPQAGPHELRSHSRQSWQRQPEWTWEWIGLAQFATNVMQLFCVFLISDMIYQNILVTYSYIFDHLTLISIINILTDRLLFLPQGHRQNPHCMCLELGWIDKRIWILPILVRSSIITGIKILEFQFLFPPFCLNDLPLSAHLLSLKLPSSSEKMSFCKGQKMSKLTRSSSIKNPGSSEIKFQFETWNLNTASVSISFIICLSLISFMSTDIIQVFSLFNANNCLIHSIH